MEEFSSYVIISIRVYHIGTVGIVLICFFCFVALCNSGWKQKGWCLLKLQLAQKETLVFARILLSLSEIALVSA